MTDQRFAARGEVKDDSPSNVSPPLATVMSVPGFTPQLAIQLPPSTETVRHPLASLISLPDGAVPPPLAVPLTTGKKGRMKLVASSVAAVVLLFVVVVLVTLLSRQVPAITPITSQSLTRKPATEPVKPNQDGIDPIPLHKAKEPEQLPPVQEVAKQPIIPNATEPEHPAPDNETVANFLTAYRKTPFAERGKYVTDPKKYDELQEVYYQDSLIPEEIQCIVKTVKTGPKANYLTVTVSIKYTLDGKEGTEPGKYYLVTTKDGLKIDWLAIVGYNPVGFKEWAAGTNGTLTLSVEAELSDYYNYQFAGAADTHYSVQFHEEFGNRDDQFYGYVSKTSDLGKQMFKIVKDGQKHGLIVTIARTGRETSVVGIQELVSESWVK
jgi:hypothetical protein